MARKKQVVPGENMTPEEERAYWDAQDPLRQGKRVRVLRLQPSEDRLSYFALRISGRDIDRLVESAKKQGMKPSELARALILRGLEQATGQPSLEEHVAFLDREVAQLKKQLAELPKKLGPLNP